MIAFNSFIVCFGSMGVVCSYVLQVVTNFWIEEKKELKTWKEVKAELESGELLRNKEYRSISIQMNPFEIDGRRLCIVVKHKVTEKPHGLYFMFKAKMRNLKSEIIGNRFFAYYFTIIMVRLYPKRVPRMINTSLKALKDDKYINKSFRVMYQGLDHIKEKAYDAEYAFPIKDNGYIEVVEKIFKRANFLKEEGNIYQTSPLGLRFVRKTEAYLSPESDMDVCYIDTPVLLRSYACDLILSHYQDIMISHRGRPHWGKVNTKITNKTVRKLYPKTFDLWKDVYDKFNRKGIFCNDFTKRVVS